MRLICLIFLTILAGEALGQTRWEHNGSVVTLHADGPNREFRYALPRAGLPVASGTVLFTGRKDGSTYSGLAYVFSSRCGARPYQVVGTVAEDQRSVSMEGNAPVVDSACKVVGHRDDVLFFSLIEPNTPASGSTFAQSTFDNLCPSPGRWVQGGGGMMCQCPDGKFLSLGQSCQTDLRDQREAEEKVRKFITTMRGFFLADWKKCISSPSTELEIVDAMSACDSALRNDQATTVEHNMLRSHRNTLSQTLASLRQQHLQREQEKERRHEFELNAAQCRNFDVRSCDAAYNSSLASRQDRLMFSALALAVKLFREQFAACRAGSAIACDRALSAAAASPSDKFEIQQLRAQTSYLEKVKAFALPLMDDATQALKRMWANVSNAVPSQYALNDVPRSTVIASAVAVALAIALGLVLLGKGADLSMLFGKRGEGLALAARQGPSRETSESTFEKSRPLNTTPHSLVIAARAREAEQVDDARSEKSQAETSSRNSSAPATSQTSEVRMESAPSPGTAYILNVLLPGAGNIYFGQPVIGVIFILSILLGLFMFFFGASAAIIGLLIILVSAVAAIFTLGISLIVGLPIGLIFLLMGAGPVVAFLIWIFSLIVSELLVYTKAKKAVAAV